MNRWVEISFDCLPMRSITRLDVPIDASPKYQAKCQRIIDAIARHGAHNSYYLHNAKAVYHLTNSETVGMLEFEFEGTLLTDAKDERAETSVLTTQLVRETCDWLTEPIVAWFETTIARSVGIEFDRYIAAGDLERTKERIAQLEESQDEAGGFVGMYL